jgi:hypothetical protein
MQDRYMNSPHKQREDFTTNQELYYPGKRRELDLRISMCYTMTSRKSLYSLSQ